MKIFNSIKEMQVFSLSSKRDGKKVAVVPTMGFLHEGHMSLIDIAKKEADIVVVTIFVNPTQFGPNEDFSRYPRDFERDSRLCHERGTDAIFAPEASEMYPTGASTWITEDSLSKGLCGKSRPLHFRGVTTVVAKLFNAVLPDLAVFGQKDAQQLAVIKRMVRDLNFPVKIIAGPIVREADGLAMSSRNKYLSPDERKNALSISSALREAGKKIFGDSAGLRDFVSSKISSNGGRVDYVEVVDAETLEPDCNFERPLLIAVAAYFGTTRLIDNTII
ncbi:MAG: pantoate--beta-alanine ligase [Lentisphaerae bacterium GWF2_45_14]|nr:MAG: pantoate--beta-alanine ligase [Lentisphaerae bacterium GWF2_45_14]